MRLDGNREDTMGRWSGVQDRIAVHKEHNRARATRSSRLIIFPGAPTYLAKIRLFSKKISKILYLAKNLPQIPNFLCICTTPKQHPYTDVSKCTSPMNPEDDVHSIICMRLNDIFSFMDA